MQRDDIKMLVTKWWDIYNDESLEYNKTVTEINDGAVDSGALQAPLIAAAMTEPSAAVWKYVTAPSAA